MRRALLCLVLLTLGVVVPTPEKASAAEPEIAITLSQSSADSRIELPVDFIATVTTTVNGQTVPAEGWAVEFTGTGDGGWTSPTLNTVGDGTAVYSRATLTPGDETITAEVVSAGCSKIPSSPVTHQWWTANSLSLDPINADTSNPDIWVASVGGQVGVIATVQHNLQPLEGEEVTIEGSSLPPGDTSIKTDSKGVATSNTWTSNQVVDQVIKVSVKGTDLSISITMRWVQEGPNIALSPNRRPAQAKNHLLVSKRQTSTVRKAQRLPPRAAAVGNPPPFTITLTPSETDARIGTPMTWTASVTIPNGGDTVPVQGIDVIFSVANARWADTTVVTGENGVATFTPPTGMTPLTDTVTATVGLDGCGSLTSTAETFEWWRPVITLSPLDASTEVGGSFDLHVSVTHSGGKPVNSGRLQALQESTCNPTLVDHNDPESQTAEIVDGEADFTFSRDVPTVDRYTVSEIVDLDPVQAETTHTWTPSPSPSTSVALVPEAGDSRVGTDVAFTATVTVGQGDGEATPSPGPGSGLTVTFSGVDVGTKDVVTDSQGQAKYTYHRSSPITDHVVASTSWGCATVSSSVSDYEWWIPSLTLSPPDTTTPAGTDAEFTASLTHDGTPAPGQLEFSDASTSCDLPVQPFPIQPVSEDGTAKATFRRSVPSIDTITVREVGDVLDPQMASTTHIWGVPDPLPITIRLTQSSPNGRVGTDLTVTALVLVDDGDGGTGPDVGVPVKLLGADGREIGPVVTDDRGIAVFHYTRSSVGQDHLSATVPYGCDVITSNRLTHDWWLPELTLSPVNASSTVGGLARVTATLRHDGHRIPGRVHLTIHHSLAGQKILNATTANNDGRVSRRWTRTVAGVDTITAVERANVLPVSATTNHKWVARPVKKALTLVVTPDGTSGRVDTDFTVTAVTRFGGVNQDGVQVHYDASMLDDSTLIRNDPSGPVPTGSSFFTHTRHVSGIERIVVTATFRGRTATQTVTRTWTEKPKPPKPVLRLAFGPDGTSSPVGSTFAPTATVTRDGKPVDGVKVSFTSRLKGVQDPPVIKPTLADGTATFPYTWQQPGTDADVANAEVDGVKLSRRIEHEWKTDGQPTLTPPVLHAGSGTGRPGGDLPITGEGCRPNETVTIFVDDVKIATTTADAEGRYQVRAAIPNLPLGRHDVRASCGSVSSTATVDLSAAQSGGGAAAAGVTTAAVLCFFVLIGNALLREFNPGSIRTR